MRVLHLSDHAEIGYGKKIFKHYPLKSIDAMRAELKEAILYMKRKLEIVNSISSFPYIVRSP